MLTMAGNSRPTLRITPTELDFGPVFSGDIAHTYCFVTYYGDDVLLIESAMADLPGFEFTISPLNSTTATPKRYMRYFYAAYGALVSWSWIKLAFWYGKLSHFC